MDAGTVVRPAASGRHQAGGHRSPAIRSRISPRILTLTAGLLAVSAVGAAGRLSGPLTLALAGLLLALLAGGGARPIGRVRRTAAVAGAMLLGYLGVAAILTSAAYLGTVPASSLVVQVVATLIIALPLVMPETEDGPPAPSDGGRKPPAPLDGGNPPAPLDGGNPPAPPGGGNPPAPPGGGVTRRELILSVTGAFVLTVGYLSGGTFLVLAAAAVGVPLAGIALRAWLAVRGRIDGGFVRRPLRRAHRGQLSQAVNALVFCGLLAATTLPGTYDVLADGIPGGVSTVRTTIALGAAIVALTAFAPQRRVPIAVNLFVAASSAFLAAQLVATYRTPAHPVVLSAPFAGDWYAVQGGHSELVNAHRVRPAQRDALDFVQVVGGSTHASKGTRLADYYAFDAPILAPADGVVVYLSDSLADRAVSAPGPGADGDGAEGNHMVIDIGGDRYVHLADLEQNSALVSVGDRVERGQAIARVGNNGDDGDEPHLHIQVQDSPRPDIHRAGVHTLPIVFRGTLLTRDTRSTHPATVDVRRGDRIHADAL